MRPLTIAIPKGRVLKKLGPLLGRAGLQLDSLDESDRRLVRETADGRFRFLLLKPDDVPTYVEYGAAALGIVGRDVLLERRYDLYQPLDLGIARCRMVVAGPEGAEMPPAPRIATKYPRITADFFAAQGVQAEVIFVQGSVELGPITGLSDFIVDLVETGTTLRENHLVVWDVITEISSVLVANRSLFKMRHEELSPFVQRLRQVVAEQAGSEPALRSPHPIARR